MSFAQGLFAGSTVAQRGMDNYNKRQAEETQGKLFELANEEQEINAGDQEVGSIMDMVGQASMGDIQKSLADAYIASGEKIDSKVYNAINMFSQGLFDVKEKAVSYNEKRTQHEQKKKLFSKQMDNYDSKIAKRGRLTKTELQQNKHTKLMKNADYIREKYGDESAKKYIASNWTAKEFGNIDDDYTVDTPKEEKPKAKKASWKDYL